MKKWDDIWEEIIKSDEVKNEYKKAFLLNMFKKICVRMKNDKQYESQIRTLYRQTSDFINTTKQIVLKSFDYEMTEAEASLMWQWINANRHKGTTRKKIPLAVKKELYEEQNGFCPICKRPLGTDWDKIHVDHIIPWSLVGDELMDNYQDLCESCNESKNAKIDYIFMSLINMN